MDRVSVSPLVRRVLVVALVLASSVVAHRAMAADIGAYQAARTFSLPAANPASSGTVLFDALPDGRLITLNGAAVSVETGVGTGAFSSIGSVANFAPAFGPSFFAVSPDGLRAAAGNNNGSVVVFSTSAPATSTAFSVADFEGTWIDNNRLAISNSVGVQFLNTSTSAVTSVITNVGGASAGITFDAAGNLYTGNGFDFAAGGSGAGWVKAFTPTQVAQAITSGTPIDFEAAGTPIVDLLTAGSLGFDQSGNFFVGGGDFFGGSSDIGYAALVDADTIAAALASSSATPPITPSSPADALRKFAMSQATIDAAQAPFWTYNDTTGELYLRAFMDGTVTVYVVPEPGLLSAIGAAGLFLRRRRRAIAATAVLASSSVATAYTFDANDFAVEVVSSTGLPGSTIYNDPQAVLGRPTLKFNNSSNPAVTDLRRAKLVEAVFNTGATGEKLITTIANGSQLTVRMGRPVTNDPNNPFGVDFIVFGNAFFAGSGFTGDDANLNASVLGGALFAENTKVSVSPDNVNWYRYDSGPFADGAYPTNSYLWDSNAAAWTNIESDPTLPVDPVLLGQVAGKTAAGVLDAIYKGSAGGTGFDLAPSGFSSIQYIRVEGLTGFAGGEVDAFADVHAIVPEPTMLALLGMTVVGRRRR